MNEIIMVSLVIQDEKNNCVKLKMKDSYGQICEEVALPVLDYMLSSYKSLDRYFEEALKNNWITSSNVTVKIISNDGKEYALPFDKNVETIYRCSEAAIFRGGKVFIEKGNEPKMVSAQEFEGFFNEFLYSVLSEAGKYLVEHGYFEKYSTFESTLKEYQSLNEKEDDIYAESRANTLEKGFSSCRNPKTIEDYLRNYSIFRDSLEFIRECKNLKLEQKKEEKNKKVKGQVVPDRKRELFKKREASYYVGKRSLCYIIGNNAAPLILETDTPSKLDDFVRENFKDAKDVKKRYKEQIVEYIKMNKDYVIQIRNTIHNENYNGQLAILEYNEDGTFKRLSGGQYFRLPVIYTSTFNRINKLYCNIDTLKRQYMQLGHEERKLQNQILVEKARHQYLGLQNQLVEVVNKLEEEQKITTQERQKTLEEMKQIISDMQELEKEDYLFEKSGFKTRPRMFAPHISDEVRYVRAEAIPKSYKIALDEWAKQIQTSDYKYDHIRFIMRHLRKKNNFKMEKEANREIEIDDSVPIKRQLEIDHEHIIDPSDNMYDGNTSLEGKSHKQL